MPTITLLRPAATYEICLGPQESYKFFQDTPVCASQRVADACARVNAKRSGRPVFKIMPNSGDPDADVLEAFGLQMEWPSWNSTQE
jgi:hypothetical protein